MAITASLAVAIFCCFLLFLYLLKPKPSEKTIGPLPPSPPGALPLIGHLHILGRPIHRALAHLSQLHGPVFLLRFGSRPVLVVSSLPAALQCLGTQDHVFATRPLLSNGRILGYNFTEIVYAPYGPLVRNLRRIAAVEVLSTCRLDALSAVRNEEVVALARELAASAEGGQFVKVEMRPLLFGLIMNMMMVLVVWKMKRKGDDVEVARKLREIVEETFAVSAETNIGDHVWGLKWLGKIGLERRMWALRHERDSFLQDLIERRKKQDVGDGRRTVLDVMLSLNEKDPEYYTDDIVNRMVMIMLSAGADTTASTLEWAMSLLLNNPETILAARAEIDKVVPPGEMIAERHLPQLPYLQAIVTETLRLYPALPLLAPHESREECVVEGYHIPRGVMLLVNTWAIHRDETVWEEPYKFKPERFLRREGKGSTRILSFSMGRRSCPGEGMGSRMVALTVATLIRCFDWERVGGGEVDMTEGHGLALHKVVPLEAMCKLREDMASLLLPQVL